MIPFGLSVFHGLATEPKDVRQNAGNPKVAIQIRQSSAFRQFNDIVLKAIDLGLVRALGESAAAAVKFYIDTSSVCEDPYLFENSLAKLFGSSEMGQKHVEDQIKNLLVELFASECSLTIPVREWSRNEKSLHEFITACKREYNHRVALNIRQDIPERFVYIPGL